jgi:hypothetical protein
MHTDRFIRVYFHPRNNTICNLAPHLKDCFSFFGRFLVFYFASFPKRTQSRKRAFQLVMLTLHVSFLIDKTTAVKVLLPTRLVKNFISRSYAE